MTERTSTQNLQNQVYEYLVDTILEGSLSPGDKLSESKIAEKFHISRTPVRLAIEHLCNEGILEHKANCNPTVVVWDNQKILQLEIVRTDLENLSARLAIIYGSNHDFEELRKHSENCYKAGLEGDIVGTLNEDSAFHVQIARISKNEKLVKFMTELHRQIRFMLCWNRDFLVSAERQYSQHNEIIDALIKRDESLVLQLLTHHNCHIIQSTPGASQFTSEFFLK